MIVQELIDILMHLEPNAKVFVGCMPHAEAYEVTSAYASPNDTILHPSVVINYREPETRLPYGY